MKARLLILLSTTLLLGSCVTNKILNYALQRDAAKDASRYQWALNGYKMSHPQDNDWLRGLKDTTIVSELDGTTLHGLFCKSIVPTAHTAVLLHGYGCNSAEMLSYASFYGKELGYNVLIPDFHAHGLSGGEMRRMGWLDRLDMVQWMKLANRLFSIDGADTEMVVTGVSMGGATTMMVSGEVEEQGLTFVKCFVEDCGYTSVYDQFSSVAKGKFRWLLNMTDSKCQKRLGWSLSEASSTDQIAKCHLPMLFIHGGSDTYVPTKMVYELYDNKPGVREIWIPDGVEHARSFGERRQVYKAKVRDFLMKYIGQW